MALTRRDFLRRSACGAVSLAALNSGIDRLGMMQAFAQGGSYRALVCIFMAGGNDGKNTVVTLDSGGYASYSAARSATGPAIAQTNLLPITSKSICAHLGLHPRLADIYPPF